jgi:histidinol dehydrogenase
MKVYRNPSPDQWAGILKRPQLNTQSLEQASAAILKEVRQGGDAALRFFTAQYDKVELTELAVPAAELQAAQDALPDELKEAIRTAAMNIQRFHARQLERVQKVETMPGVTCWRKSVPIDRVGLYVPGGTAPLFSTVLMLGIPAVLAGCEQVVLCTPPRKDGGVHPAILFSARLIGIERVYKVGGVQAIGAMAYGTATIPRVYKIFGLGNQYVTAAKQLVAREGIAIDMPAGPSEVLVCADETARPRYVAADLLSQAEHGPDSQVVLVALDAGLLEAVQQEVEKQLNALPRREIAEKALHNSALIRMDDRQQALALINAYAPEHLILSVDEAETFAEGIRNAGSVFLGHYTPESVGDYASGTNHTLPTNGFARTHSGVSLDSFVKKITFQELSPEGLQALGPKVERMAEAEELMGHKQAVRVRLEELDG